MQIDIDSNIDEALGDIRDMFERQFPFAVSQAMVDTAFETRKRIVTSTWGEAFDVNNQRFAGVAIRIQRPGGDRVSAGGMTREFRATGGTSVSVGDSLGREWMERQATGGTKTSHTGGQLAIPVTPSKVRAPTGRVRAPLKPGRITDKKRFFVKYKGGRKTAIMERRRGSDTMTAVYLFTQTATIPKRLMFYEDAMETMLGFFPVSFDRRLDAVIRGHRFFRG